MAKTRLRLKRGTTEAHENYSGFLGEITFDTDKSTAVIWANANTFYNLAREDQLESLSILSDSLSEEEKEGIREKLGLGQGSISELIIAEALGTRFEDTDTDSLIDNSVLVVANSSTFQTISGSNGTILQIINDIPAFSAILNGGAYE